MNSFLIVSLIFLSTLVGYGDAPQSPEAAMRSALDNIKTLNAGGTKYITSLRYSAAYGGKDVETSALIALWLRGESPPVELAWWKSTNKNVRTIIVALFLCDRTDPIDWIPDFTQYSNRFDSKERGERLTEVQYVLSHRKELAAILFGFLKEMETSESLTKEQLTLLRNYQDAAQ